MADETNVTSLVPASSEAAKKERAAAIKVFSLAASNEEGVLLHMIGSGALSQFDFANHPGLLAAIVKAGAPIALRELAGDIVLPKSPTDDQRTKAREAAEQSLVSLKAVRPDEGSYVPPTDALAAILVKGIAGKLTVEKCKELLASQGMKQRHEALHATPARKKAFREWLDKTFGKVAPLAKPDPEAEPIDLFEAVAKEIAEKVAAE